jgi:hypothetical protein
MVSPTCSSKSSPSYIAPLGSALDDALTFHVCDLCQDSKDQLADTPADAPETVDIDRHPSLDQIAYGALNIQCIAAKAIHRIHAHSVALTNVLKQFREPRTLRRWG